MECFYIEDWFCGFVGLWLCGCVVEEGVVRLRGWG